MADEVRLIDAEKLKRRLIEGDGHDDDRFTEGYNFAINEIKGYIDNMPTVEAITREQFAEAAKQLMNEFTANDGYGTSASATVLALCFGNLELRLFGNDGE